MHDELKLRVLAPMRALGEADAEVVFEDALPVEPVDPLTDARFIEPVSVVVVGVAAAVVSRLVRAWERQRERGAIVDLRVTPPSIDYLAAVPFGTLLVIDADGNPQTYELGAESGGEFERIVQSVVSGMAGGG